jgi:phage anti-repressor protein
MNKKTKNQTFSEISEKVGSLSETIVCGFDRGPIPVEAGANGLWVNSLLLYEKLKVATRHNDWITRRIKRYGFVENSDYSILNNPNRVGRGRRSVVYSLTLTMAGELALHERNETGRAIRRYFIEIERSYRDWIGVILL